MTSAQLITLLVLAAVVAALIWARLRSDVVALTGAAFLLMTGVVRPVEVQSAFASPAIVALASLFVIAYAMELAGLLDEAIRRVVKLCRHIGKAGLWVLLFWISGGGGGGGGRGRVGGCFFSFSSFVEGFIYYDGDGDHDDDNNRGLD